MIKVSDYIVEFLVKKGITDVFGYPGGMVTHLMDSFLKHEDSIRAHVSYHEQAAAFSACAYAQVAGKPGVAYATSGPGATNLITGIANAYFDSIPIIFITGQVNTYEMRGKLSVRQRGFQETDIISIVKSITKYAVCITKAEDIPYCFEKAYYECMKGRRGPVLLDIPMDVSRSYINISKCEHYSVPLGLTCQVDFTEVVRMLNSAKKPVIIAGRGIAIANVKKEFRELIENLKIPVVTSMIAVDCILGESKYNFGFLGAYGHRFANFIVQNSDLILSMGSRLDCRQTGIELENFAPEAKIIRIDVDREEFTHKIKEDEWQICADLKEVIKEWSDWVYEVKEHCTWLKICGEICENLKGIDDLEPNLFVKQLGGILPERVILTTDVGQNQVWIAQSLKISPFYQVLFSGGLGAMGYSLPAAIGAYYGSGGNRETIISINGDGGFQMNLQELQFIKREKIPIKIVVFNNRSLGMIRHFQEMYFNGNYVQTKIGKGYDVVNLELIAKTYDIEYGRIESVKDIDKYHKNFRDNKPFLMEIVLTDTTYIYPKLAMGHPIHDQDRLMDRKLFKEMMELCANV